MNEIPQLTVMIGDTIRTEVIIRATGETLYEETGEVVGFPKYSKEGRSVEIRVTEHEFFVGCHSSRADGRVSVRHTKYGTVGSLPSVVAYDEFEDHLARIIEGESKVVELLRLTA